MVASNKLLKDIPSEDEMFEIMHNLGTQSHQTIAIMSGAYIDNALEKVLTAKFRPLNREDQGRLFRATRDGFLTGTDAKIRIAYAISLIGKFTYTDLLLINAIRNVFAHSMHSVSFTDPLIVKDCGGLVQIAEYTSK